MTDDVERLLRAIIDLDRSRRDLNEAEDRELEATRWQAAAPRTVAEVLAPVDEWIDPPEPVGWVDDPDGSGRDLVLSWVGGLTLLASESSGGVGVMVAGERVWVGGVAELVEVIGSGVDSAPDGVLPLRVFADEVIAAEGDVAAAEVAVMRVLRVLDNGGLLMALAADRD